MRSSKPELPTLRFTRLVRDRRMSTLQSDKTHGDYVRTAGVKLKETERSLNSEQLMFTRTHVVRQIFTQLIYIARILL